MVLIKCEIRIQELILEKMMSTGLVCSVWDADWIASGHNLAGNWKRLAIIIDIDVGYIGIFRDR